jgi:preprotein translocase subunit SecA
MEMMDKSFVPEESGHFTVDEKSRSVELTESGHEFVEQILISKNFSKKATLFILLRICLCSIISMQP